MPFARVRCTLEMRDRRRMPRRFEQFVAGKRAMTIRIESVLLLVIRLGVFLILLTPLVVTPGTLFPYVVGKAIYARALIEVVFFCWVLLVMRNPLYRPRRSWILWLFSMYVFASLVAAFAGVSFQRSFWGDYRRMGGVFDLAHWFAFAVVLVSVLRETRHWRWLLNANLGVSLLVALLGLAQHYDVRMFDGLFWYLQPTERVDVTFGNPTYVGAFMLVNVFVALAFLAHSYQWLPQPSQSQTRRERRRQRVPREKSNPSLMLWRAFWVLTTVLDLWVLTLSGTRGAMAGLVVGLLIAGVGYLLWGRRGRLKLLAGVLVALLLLVGLSATLARDTPTFRKLAESNVMARRLDYMISQGFSASYKSRLMIASVGLRAFTHAPVLGWGPENFVVAFDRVADAEEFPRRAKLADQAHNKPVEELTTRGIVGFGSYVLLLGMMAWILARIVRREPGEQLFALFMGGALIAYVVQALFLFDTPGTFLQFLLLLGWVAWKETALLTGEGVSEERTSRPGSVRPRGGVAGTSLADIPGGDAIRWSYASSVVSRLRTWFQIEEVRLTAMISLATLSGIAIALAFIVNVQSYRAAQSFPLQGTSLEQFFTKAQHSFQTFPPLATLGRQILLDTFLEHWDNISKRDEDVFVKQLQVEGEAALEKEPQNARLYLGLARIYQRAGASDPRYLPVARGYIETAQILAPDLPQTVEISNDQEVLEQATLLAPGCRDCVLWLSVDVGQAPAFRDESDFKNYGSMTGVSLESGMSGDALSFDGVDDYVDFENLYALDQDFAEITLAGWINTDSGQGKDAGLFGKGTHAYGFTLHGASPLLHFYIGGGGNYVRVDYGPFLGGWHHVVGTFDGTDLRLYIDGQLAASKVSRVSSTGTKGTLTLGRATTYFEGLIETVRVYSHALSAAEVATLYGGD